MRYRSWPVFVTLIAIASGCGGSSPSAPTKAASTATSSSVQGATVSAIDGQPLAGITVQIGSQSTVSDASGAFHLNNVASGQPAVLAAPSVVERHTVAIVPSLELARETLIPASFDLAAFDQMFRGNGRLERWTSAPQLVVITTVMNYEISFGDNAYFHATSEQLTDTETDLLVAQLTDALTLLTGNTFTAFGSVDRESASPGATVNTLRAGKIVVGRYKGLQGLLNTIGFGRWASDANGQVTAASIYLDRDFDKTSDSRRLLRTHELGHALGYNHVTTRTSIMNPAIGPEPSTFDRQGATVAFDRMPGNQSPDTDPSGPATSGPGGGVFGIAPAPIWSPPTVRY
jgi:Matrixin